MTTDQGPVVNSAQLRGELVRLRREGGLTQQQVAKELEWSTSKLIRIEGGHSAITMVDLDALLNKYRVASAEEREELHTLNREAKESGWWDRYRGKIGSTYLDYVGYEAGAVSLRQTQNAFVPGLLQTAAYARVVTVVGAVEADDEDKIATVVGLRMQRQEELARRDNPPELLFAIDEAVIRRHVGLTTDPAIMPDQLRHVADRTESDERLSVRVIPFGTGEHPGQFGPFTLLKFAGRMSEILYLDAGLGGVNMVSGDEPPQVAEYAEYFEELLAAALSPEDSIQLIRTAADELS
jgi:transcriptional regulator with XRE-family HTH domain